MTLHVPDLTSDVQTTSSAGFAPHRSEASGAYRYFFKRVLDLTLVIVSLPVVFPLIACLAVLVAVLTGGKPFYTQLRVGKGGERFRMWKLRTMVKNADAQLESYLQQDPEARAEWDNTQKLKKDPRITPIGRLLRKTSADELPQLFNVLNGTMSLVGPRPMMIEQQAFYKGKDYYQLRPGLTGLWQVSDRNECEFGGRVAYDNIYNRTLSLKTDIHILFKTIGVVMRATGH